MTKKLLLGTTAIVAGGMVVADMAEAADPIRLEIRGYRNEYFGVSSVQSDVDNENFNNTTLFSEGEVQFRGSTTLDNGIEIGVQVELEAFGAGDQVDENYVDVSGGFGEFRIGSDDPAGQKVGVVSPGVGVPINSGWVEDFIPSPDGFVTGDFGSTPAISADDNMITYFSPRFAGFQIGASYIPTVQNDGEGSNSLVDDNDRDNGVSVGLNFSRGFNGVDIEAGVGYQFVDDADERDDDDDDDNPQDEIFNAGTAIGFGGFTVGGSYGVRNDRDENDGYVWDIGASYETGPWGVSGQFVSSTFEGDSGGGDDEAFTIGGAVAYALGPGIKTDFTVIYADYDAENGGDDGDGIAAVLGLSVGF